MSSVGAEVACYLLVLFLLALVRSGRALCFASTVFDSAAFLLRVLVTLVFAPPLWLATAGRTALKDLRWGASVHPDRWQDRRPT